MTMIPELPPPPQSTDPVNFSVRADAWMSAVSGFSAAANAQARENNLAASTASTAAATAGSHSAAAKSAADEAISMVGAGRYSATAAYQSGDLCWSPANGLIYRRLTAGAGGADPSADPTHWELSRNFPVGSRPNQVPAGKDLSHDAYGSQGIGLMYRHTPDSRPGDCWREYVNDTTTTIKFHGFDGVIRSRSESWT
ncbi:MAG: hypothetical protein RSE32_08145 [Comamonas sp.]|uniref:hypothetical protein n=1 Tax=Comamonas sp. TaxID=34028 RepID=UPI002FC77062